MTLTQNDKTFLIVVASIVVVATIIAFVPRQYILPAIIISPVPPIP